MAGISSTKNWTNSNRTQIKLWHILSSWLRACRHTPRTMITSFIEGATWRNSADNCPMDLMATWRPWRRSLPIFALLSS